MCLSVSPRTYRRYRQKARQQKKRVYYKVYEKVGNKIVSPIRHILLPVGKKEVISDREKNNLPKNKVYPKLEQSTYYYTYEIDHAIHVYQSIEVAKKHALTSDIIIPVIGYSEDFIAGNSREAALNKVYIERKTWEKIKQLLKIDKQERSLPSQVKKYSSLRPHLKINEDGF
jgi:hypothetical protein